jgi:hypothetical protein
MNYFFCFANKSVGAIANASEASQSSLQRLQNWGFRENIVGLKASLASVGK